MSDHYLKLYVGDYLADTGHLSTVEHGAYLLLLMHSWRTGPLPDDDARLAAIARMSRPEWRRVADVIRAFFTSTDAGLIQRRLERERNERGMKTLGPIISRYKADPTDKKSPTIVIATSECWTETLVYIE